MKKILGLALLISLSVVSLAVAWSPPGGWDSWKQAMTTFGFSATDASKTTMNKGLLWPAGAYLNFGSTYGTSGYGLRESSGKIQFKHSGESWADMGSGSIGANLTSIDGLTFADVSIIELTGVGGSAVVTSGGANRLYGSNSDNTATEFKSSLTGITLVGAFTTYTGVPTVSTITTGILTQDFAALLPDAADGASLGNATYEWSDIYLADGAVIYGQNDQSNTMTSSATGWTMNLNLVVTGTISGGVVTNSDANGMTSGEMTTVGLNGTMFWATGAGTWALPSAAAGMSFCVYSTTAAAIVINPDDGDIIVLNGTALSAGDSITSASGAGDFICLMGKDANTWYTLGRSGTWTDTN